MYLIHYQPANRLTGTAASAATCGTNAGLQFCPAAASAQASSCRADCSGCSGYTTEGKTTCLAAAPAPVTCGAKMCGAGTTYDKAKQKCEIISPTDIELATMCGEGTTYDKAKKKCVTDPTSRCTTNSESAEESAGSAPFVSRTATLTATVIIVLFYKF